MDERPFAAFSKVCRSRSYAACAIPWDKLHPIIKGP
jgi:hypothetical protein